MNRIYLYINIECVSDCTEQKDGDYQSCTNCNTYVTCSNGLTYADRPCPADLVWNDNLKRCEYESNTCTPKLSGIFYVLYNLEYCITPKKVNLRIKIKNGVYMPAN